MRLPRMTETERAVFAALYAQAHERLEPAADNSAAELSLEEALWGVECFRQAVRERKP